MEPTMTSVGRRASICWTWMPSILASDLYFLALARMVPRSFFSDVGCGLHPHHHAAGFGLVENIRRDNLHDDRKAPCRFAILAASATDLATPSFGTGMP